MTTPAASHGPVVLTGTHRYPTGPQRYPVPVRERQSTGTRSSVPEHVLPYMLTGTGTDDGGPDGQDALPWRDRYQSNRGAGRGRRKSSQQQEGALPDLPDLLRT